MDRPPLFVFFDCDGVLVDSEIIANRVVHAQLLKLGYPVDFNTYSRTYAGMKEEEILHDVSEKYGLIFPELFKDLLNREIDLAFKTDVLPIKGARQTFLSIPLPKAVVSNSPIDRVRFSLNKLDILQEVEGRIFTADMAGVPKPNPAIYLFAANQVGFKPSEIIAVEDSPTGVKSASSAGIYTIGFCGASHIQSGHDKQLISSGAYDIAYDMEEVFQKVTSLLKP